MFKKVELQILCIIFITVSLYFLFSYESKEEKYIRAEKIIQESSGKKIDKQMEAFKEASELCPENETYREMYEYQKKMVEQKTKEDPTFFKK